jgi:N-methylhydantoinase B
MSSENQQSEEHQGTKVWEDFRNGYVPREKLDIHRSISLHTETTDIDTVTYEVLRHRLHSINEEHGHTLENISGSPVAYFGQDFNPTILSEEGEVIFQGPYIQFFSPIAELQVKWILENRSDNPGIEPGDVFLSNDPWVGSTHQPDVFFIAPLFRDGELFCWVVNTLHQYDIGGISAGSFCSSADDVFEEPTPIPPIKAVEGGVVRDDVREMYLRHSRLPNLIALDFNAQVAGCKTTRNRINEVIDEYGADEVKAVMYKIIEDSETKFIEKLKKIPNGTWRAREYLEGAKTGDTNVYPVDIQLTKEDDQLTFKNEGSAENAGNMNITYAGFRTAIMAYLAPVLLYDELYVPSGPLRHINIETTPGTVNRAQWPSGVSPGGTTNIEFSIGLIQDVVMKMLSASEELKKEIISDTPTTGVLAQAGIDQWGEPFGTMNLDVLGASIGAKPHRDGIDVGGYLWGPKGPLPNMEHNERDYPILYLYKERAADTGGPGEYRGGVSLRYAFVPHKTEHIQTTGNSVSGVTPVSAGIGSYPAIPAINQILGDTDIHDHFEDGNIPENISDLGRPERLAPKNEFVQSSDDIVEVIDGAAPGYGDPLKRDPEEVAEDVSKGLVSEEAAIDIHGVVLEEDGNDFKILEEQTENRRKEIREERLAESTAPAEQGV